MRLQTNLDGLVAEDFLADADRFDRLSIDRGGDDRRRGLLTLWRRDGGV